MSAVITRTLPPTFSLILTARGFGGLGVGRAVDGIVRVDLGEIDGKLYRSIIVWRMRDAKISMVRHSMDITDEGVVIYWDKYLKLTATSASIQPLPKEEVDEMRKAIEETEKATKEVKAITRETHSQNQNPESQDQP